MGMVIVGIVIMESGLSGCSQCGNKSFLEGVVLNETI